MLKDFVTILSNDFVNIPPYSDFCSKRYGHLAIYQDFVRKYDSKLTYCSDDKYDAVLRLTKLGYLSYKTISNSLLVFYIPDSVTDDQLTYFEDHLEKFKNWETVGAYSINFPYQSCDIYAITGLDCIHSELLLKNKKGKVDHNNMTLIKERR